MDTTIRIDDTGIPDGVLSIIDQLPPPGSLRSENRIVLKFRHQFVYLTGLVLLAAWRKSLPPGIPVVIDDSAASLETQRFLTNTGFREVVETGVYHPSVPSRIGKVPIQAILRGREKDATVSEVVRIFDDYAGQVRDTAPFRVLLSELCENVLSHSELTTPGYICARVLDHLNKCEIAIADTGIGIEQSFRHGTNSNAVARIQGGDSPLAIAIEGLSSSKPLPAPGRFQTYFGFGLFITRRLIEENRGRLTLASGSEVLTVERYNRTPRRLARGLRGTFVGLILDLDNPLPLENVYAEAEAMLVPPPTLEKQEPPLAPQSQLTAAAQPVDEWHEFRLSNYGTQLLTREAGTAIRADLASYLAAGRFVRIRLDGIDDITPSCVDDAFGKLSEIIGLDEFQSRVMFEGGPPIAKTLINFVLKTRQRTS